VAAAHEHQPRGRRVRHDVAPDRLLGVRRVRLGVRVGVGRHLVRDKHGQVELVRDLGQRGQVPADVA
jgi:hypothetical protein